MQFDRRDFVRGGIVALACGIPELRTAAESMQSEDKPLTSPYGLTTRTDADTARRAHLPGSKGSNPNPLPYVYLYYDKTQKRFLTTLEVTPGSDIDASKTYHLSSKLHTFNIRSADQRTFSKLQNNVQLAFNVTAPNPLGDLTWVFMNAIDIFAKAKPNASALTSFMGAHSPGATLASTPPVTITKGSMSLQVLVFGQKRTGFWQSFFTFISGAIGNPISATALIGFGIPGLAVDALQFTDHALTELTKNEGLLPLWQTGSIDFGIDPKTKSDCKMREGTWVIIDYDYASDSSILEGHTLDIALGSYRLLNKEKKLVDANYVVTELKFAEA